MAAIVDFDERTLAFNAVAAAFCHTGIIAMGVGFGCAQRGVTPHKEKPRGDRGFWGIPMPTNVG